MAWIGLMVCIGLGVLVLAEELPWEEEKALNDLVKEAKANEKERQQHRRRWH